MNMSHWKAHNTQGVNGWAVAESHPSGDGSFYAPIAQGLSEAEGRLIANSLNERPALLSQLEGMRRALQSMVDNACAACETDASGRLVVPVTRKEWEAHCEATAAARAQLSAPPQQH